MYGVSTFSWKVVILIYRKQSALYSKHYPCERLLCWVRRNVIGGVYTLIQ